MQIFYIYLPRFNYFNFSSKNQRFYFLTKNLDSNCRDLRKNGSNGDSLFNWNCPKCRPLNSPLPSECRSVPRPPFQLVKLIS